MVNRLRIARLDPSAYVPLVMDGQASADEHQRLQDVIRRHLPQVNASLLAAPVATADGRYVEWYSDLAGQPVPLPSLPEAEQTAARTLLHDRLTALRDLADRLPTVDPGAADLAEPLRRALSYPSDDTVYAVGDQPVITFWGHQPASGAAPAGIPITAAAGGVPPDEPPPETPLGDRRRGLPWWLWLMLVLSLVVALAVGAWWYFRDLRWPPWVDYEGLLKAVQEEEVDLRERIDALEADLRERLRRCGLQSDLDAARREELDLLQRLVVLNSQLARLMELCPLKQQVQAAVAEGRAQEEKIDALEARLAAALEECRRKAEVEAEERRKAEEEERRKKEAEAQRKAEEEQRRKAEMTKPGEALKIPKSACQSGETDFMNGRWRSESDIVSADAGRPVVSYYEIRNATGRKTLYEEIGGKQIKCNAPVRVYMSGCKLVVEDVRRAACEQGKMFQRMRIVCTVGPDRRAQCQATQEKIPPFDLRIIKIK